MTEIRPGVLVATDAPAWAYRDLTMCDLAVRPPDGQAPAPAKPRTNGKAPAAIGAPTLFDTEEDTP